MKKLVKKYGNTLVITFDPEDVKIYQIEEGDFIDFSDMVITKNNKGKTK